MARIETDSPEDHLKVMYVRVRSNVQIGDNGKLIYIVRSRAAWWEFYEDE